MAATPTQVADKWAQRMSASSQQIADGVNRVTQAPGAKAAAAKNLWLQRLTAKADHWAARVGSVTVDQWKAATIAGIPRIAQGAQAKKGKVEAFMGQLLPYIEAGQGKIASMPKGDINASMARANAWMQYMANFKRT